MRGDDGIKAPPDSEIELEENMEESTTRGERDNKVGEEGIKDHRRGEGEGELGI